MRKRKIITGVNRRLCAYMLNDFCLPSPEVLPLLSVNCVCRRRPSLSCVWWCWLDPGGGGLPSCGVSPHEPSGDVSPLMPGGPPKATAKTLLAVGGGAGASAFPLWPPAVALPFLRLVVASARVSGSGVSAYWKLKSLLKAIDSDHSGANESATLMNMTPIPSKRSNETMMSEQAKKQKLVNDDSNKGKSCSFM
ncbi:hypothetical protein Hte_002559 [Hypoxylon texense]